MKKKPTYEELEERLRELELQTSQVRYRGEAVIASTERFSRINKSLVIGIILMDHHGQCIFSNSYLKKILGVDLIDTDFKDWLQFLHPKDRGQISQKWKDALLKLGPFSEEFRIVNIKGKTRWINMDTAPVFYENGTYHTGIVYDITNRRSVLKKLIRDRDAAESLNKAKSEFLANISHEIRTPMNAVIGMTSMLIDTDLLPEQRRYVDVIKKSSESLLMLINDILDFSKIEAKKLELEQIDFDLRSTIDDISDMIAVKAHEKGLDFACLIHPDVPSWLYGDPGRLRQIIMNLLDNAVKFTQKGEVILRCSLEKETDSFVTIFFSISDTGVGIPKNRINRLFKSFSQVDASTTRKYGGTGLGLAIADNLARMMGGGINVLTEAGKGSTFYFTATFKKPGEKRLPSLPVDLHGKHILLVGENQTEMDILHTYLTSWGCKVNKAFNPDNAFALLNSEAKKQNPFHVVIIDQVIPGIDGEALGSKIKSQTTMNNPSLILLTPFGMRGDANRAKEIGFSAYLTKPVKNNQLLSCLMSLLGTEKKGHPPDEETEMVTRYTISETEKQRFRILLVEDNTINQELALNYLSKLGYRADAVSNGREAIESVQNGDYDLIFMDIQMPEMDGLEATKEIRKIEQKSQHPEKRRPKSGIPIIAMTAHTMKGDREVYSESGMNDFISKPINMEKLSDLLGYWTGKIRFPRGIYDKPVANHEQPPDKKGRMIFDYEESLERSMGDKELLFRLIDRFISDFNGKLDLIRQAFSRRDFKSLAGYAHSLKGSSASLGAKRISELAFSLEKMGRDRNIEDSESVLKNLENEMAIFQNSVRPYRDL